MKTVSEVSKLTGVSIRTLQYYDKIGLLQPSTRTEAAYRLYDNCDLEKLQQILLFRELEFPLKDIKQIINSSDFDRNKALAQQIELLTLKKEHIENLITMAKGIKLTGVRIVDFSAFDTKKIDEYCERAKATWGNTPEFKEFEMKDKNRSREKQTALNQELMAIFGEFSQVQDQEADSPQVKALVNKLQDFISTHYYTCSNTILAGLGKMYGGGGEFTENINHATKDGTAEFTAKAIEIYCAR